jgi:hypothetical protein
VSVSEHPCVRHALNLHTNNECGYINAVNCPFKEGNSRKAVNFAVTIHSSVLVSPHKKGIRPLKAMSLLSQ